jgi:hypothetical protein
MDVTEGQGDSMRRIRADLGSLWGVGRPLYPIELGRALRMSPSQPGIAPRKWEAEETGIPGPASVALEMFMLGALPPDGLDKVLSRRKR